MADISSDLRTSRWGEIQETIFAPYLVIPIFLQTIGFKETKFKVTNKDAKQSNKDLLYVLPHAIMLALAVYGVITFNYGKFGDRKSTRLNSSHVSISYAVFCLKKKKQNIHTQQKT